MFKPEVECESLLYWGTNHQGGTADHYAGRTHVVWPENEYFGLCGLPIETIWEQRPPTPDNLCPSCCVRAMAVLFPAFSESLPSVPPIAGKHGLGAQDHRAPESLAEQTMPIPVIDAGDFFA